MSDKRSGCPDLAEKEALRLGRDLYGLDVTVRPLPSYMDQNFLLTTQAGARYVLKIANAAEERAGLELQDAALEHLAKNAPDLGCPRVCPARNGETLFQIPGKDHAEHFVRLLTYLDGDLFARVNPHSPRLLHSLGRFLGRLDQALVGFDHPAAGRDLPWDLENAFGSRGLTEYISHPPHRTLVEELFDRFEEKVIPLLDGLRESVIHNDGNDYNLLVLRGSPEERRVSGILDFGDMVRTRTVFEPAVAAAYAVLGKSDPLAAAAQVVSGFHTEFPLLEEEIALLFDLIRTRLCVSVTHSAHRGTMDPDNEYLKVCEGPAWEMLERLKDVDAGFACAVFRQALGLAPCPTPTRLREYLESHRDAIGPVVEPDPRTVKTRVFDLSIGSLELPEIQQADFLSAIVKMLTEQMKTCGAKIGIGRYNEARLLYTGPVFETAPRQFGERRTVHLGLDLFLPAATPVLAPLNGKIHSFQDNARPLDYGPTLVLQHDFDGGRFYTLYGHLSRDSLLGLEAGKTVQKGDRIARIGDPAENGGWPPHVHFQIICDLLGLEGDYPGVAAPNALKVWLSLCPDPNLIVRLPRDCFPPAPLPAEAILAKRAQRIGPSLSVAYEHPLKIVRGAGPYLFDAMGRVFLDGVNNVCHVGHCHPKVVGAAERQMRVLNTNTRYLHDLLVQYAERLCSCFPDPLKVCFFVCSGSEANELALRLARARTGGSDFIVLDGAYHGNTGGLVAISPYKFNGPGGGGQPAHVQVVPAPDSYRGLYRYGDSEAGQKFAGHIAEALERIAARGKKPAAFIAESLMGCGGQIIPPTGYLKAAFRFAREAGAVCIADEVQVGFGRAGSFFWGFEAQGVAPDIVTLGKPIGNGHPLAAVITTEEIAGAFANGMEYFNTFGGNPVSCAVGLAVLEVIEEEGLQENALAVGRHLKSRLEKMRDQHPIIGDVRGLGLFLGVELVLNRETLAPAAKQAAYLVERAKELGVLLATEGPFHNVIKIKPPLIFSRENADFMADTLEKILAEDFFRIV